MALVILSTLPGWVQILLALLPLIVIMGCLVPRKPAPEPKRAIRVNCRDWLNNPIK